MAKPHIIDHILYGLSGLILVSILVLLVSTVTAGKPSQSTCPAPTVEKDGICVLTKNEVLTKPIQISSGQTLDCQGYTLTPKSIGKEPTGTNPSDPSAPVAAVFLNDVTSARVQNCVIEDFDFGIVAVNDDKAEKLPPSKRTAQRTIISSNNITTLYNGINLIQADNLEISNNNIRTEGAAAGIQSLLDSDFLHINDNKIVTTKPSWREGSVANPPKAPFFPGSGDFFNFADGVSFTQMPSETTNDFRLGNTNITFVTDPSKKATNNIVEGNSIDLTQSKGTAGVYVGVFEDGLAIRNNTLMEGSWGVAISPLVYTNYFPHESTWPRNVLVENNNIQNPFRGGVVGRNAFDSVIRLNTIRSTVGEDTAGILLMGKSLETATVTRNDIQGTKHGLRLRSGGTINLVGPRSTGFGAKIFLNDILGASKSIDIPDPYNFPSELSVNGQGNYWGRTCDDSGGFKEFGEPNSDSPSPLVNDSHPYGFPVANEFNQTKMNMTCQ